MADTEAHPNLSELEAEYRTIKRQFSAASVVSIAIISGGAVFYHLVEKFSWLDSVYFCTITLATVGYGDLVPKTSFGKLFTIFYVIIGIGIIAFAVNVLVKNTVIKRQLKFARREQAANKKPTIAN